MRLHDANKVELTVN